MVEIRTPDERECLQCGRREVWDAERGRWNVAAAHVGDVYCVHDWDVTGQFTPVKKS